MATMNDCKTIQPRLSEYVDGALAENDAWKVKLHLSSCAVCERVADELSATAKLLSALPTMETSAGFEAVLARRLADRALHPRSPSLLDRLRSLWTERPAVRPAMASLTAFAAAAAMVGVFVVNRSSTAPLANTEPPAAQTVVTDQKKPATLEQVFDEHAAYASAEPLGDPAGMLMASSRTENASETGL